MTDREPDRKPKLRISWGGKWFCLSRYNTGSGDSPAQAYARWAEAVQKGKPYVWN